MRPLGQVQTHIDALERSAGVPKTEKSCPAFDRSTRDCLRVCSCALPMPSTWLQQPSPVCLSSIPMTLNVKKIYVEKMDNNLDQYITWEISRQFHGSLQVVLEPAKADGIMKGVNIGAQNTTKATVQLVDPGGKSVLWSGAGGPRADVSRPEARRRKENRRPSGERPKTGDAAKIEQEHKARARFYGTADLRWAEMIERRLSEKSGKRLNARLWKILSNASNSRSPLQLRSGSR